MIDIVKQFSFIYTLLSIMVCQSFISIDKAFGCHMCFIVFFSLCVFYHNLIMRIDEDFQSALNCAIESYLLIEIKPNL